MRVTRRFDNEAGNAVNLSVEVAPDHVLVIMRDRLSTMENVISPKEAAELHAALGDALQSNCTSQAIWDAPSDGPAPPCDLCGGSHLNGECAQPDGTATANQPGDNAT